MAPVKALREWTVKLLPWMVTSGIVGYIAYTTDLDHALGTLGDVNWFGFFPAVVGVCLCVFLFDTWCLKLLFNRFSAPVTYREMLPLKGTSYFLNVINYNAAAAGIAYFFRNKKGVRFLDALGSMLWMSFIDIVSLATLMLLGLALAGGAEIPAGYVRTLVGLASFIYLVLIGSCLYWNAGFDWFVLGRMRSWAIFGTFSRAKLSDYARFIGIRTAFSSLYVVSQWVCMPFFGMDAGLQDLFLYVPVLTFVGVIPLTTVAGMGTVQLLMREFFVSFVPNGQAAAMEAHIDAYSTTTIVTFVLCRIAIGYIYMGSVTKDYKQRAQSDAESQPSDSIDNVK